MKFACVPKSVQFDQHPLLLITLSPKDLLQEGD